MQQVRNTLQTRQRATMPSGESAFFSFTDNDKGDVRFQYDDGRSGTGSILLNEVEKAADKPQWMKDKETYDWSMNPANPNANMLGLWTSTALTPFLNFISPSQQWGAIRDAIDWKDYWRKLGHGTSGVVTENYKQDHPYLSLAANLGFDAATGTALGSLTPTNLNEAKSFIKHPLYKTYYHSSPKEFSITEARVATPADIGLHMTDSKKLALGPLSSSAGGQYVYRFRAPRAKVTTSDIWSNGAGHLNTNYPFAISWKGSIPYNYNGSIYGINVNPKDFRLIQELEKTGAYIDRTPIISMYRARSPFGSNINMRERFYDAVKDRKTFDVEADKIQKDFDALSKFEGSLGWPSNLNTARTSVNERAVKLLSDQGVDVVKYFNNNPHEGGGISYWINNPSKIDPIDLYVNGVGSTRFNFNPLKVIGASEVNNMNK